MPAAMTGGGARAQALLRAMLAMLAMLTWSLAIRHAHADESGPAGQAASIVPLAATELTLKSETIELGFAPEQRAWNVSAHYEISNQSPRAQAAQLGMPEYPCATESEAYSELDDGCDPTRNAFASLDVSLGDKTLHLHKHRVAMPTKGAALPEQAWAFPLRVPVGESAPVELHYRVPAEQPSEGGFSASYLERANMFWSKPINRATFKFVFPAHSCLVVEPENIPRKSRRVVQRGDNAWLELVFEAYGWVPHGGLTLYFEPCVAARDTELPDCSAASDLARYFYPPDADEEVTPISEPELRAALAKLNDRELEHCRDYVFTAYASYFQESELKKLPAHPESGRHYSAALLTKADWAWVHFLDARVAERKVAREAVEAAHRKATAAAAHGCGCEVLGVTSRPRSSGAFALLLYGCAFARFRSRAARVRSRSNSTC